MGNDFSYNEEIWNAITHGIGIALAVAAHAVLVVFATLHGDVWHIVTFSVYGTTLVILYLFSTLYHSFRDPKLKSIFKVIDHSAIYLLIAGSYTPFTLIALRGTIGWAIFGIIWGLAIIGVVLKVFFVKRFKIVSTLTYVLMGWMIVVAFNPLLENLSTQGVRWLVLGGVLYSGGAIFYLIKRIPYNHAIFHLFVIGGSVCHFVSILLYVLPITA